MPTAIPLPFEGPRVIGCGAESNNSFCLTRSKEAYVSWNTGDLTEYRNYMTYLESINELENILGIQPEIAAHDMHPDYITTRYAAQTGLKTESIQHHHAHIAACMLEHQLNETVIGVAFDGMGLGDDGTLWGGEFLIANFKEYHRACHFKQYPLPGGDQATIYPPRMALSCLIAELDNEHTIKRILPAIDNETYQALRHMIKNNLRSPLTSSAGRLFDAVSAMLKLCTGKITRPAEAAINLQNAATEHTESIYPFEINDNVLNFGPMLREIVCDIDKKIDKGHISSVFHNTLAAAATAVCEEIRSKEKINKVMLSGGVFLNTRLLELTTDKLHNRNFDVYTHQLLSTSDVNIGLGQAVIAMARAC